MTDPGHIELERRVDSIAVGAPHRIDLGDLEPLMRSIQRLGLLQPITIAPDGTLICGRRRLEAIRRLKWPTVKVWVRSGISDPLHRLLAWQDENTLHKPLSPTESVLLYRELKTLLAEDAERRQRASRFGAGDEDGGVDSTPPSGPAKTRGQAAQLVTGSDSHQRLDRIGDVMDVADDPATPEVVRDLARAGLDAIRCGKPVSPIHDQVISVRDRAPSDGDELARLAQEALERVKQPRARRPRSRPSGRKRSTRAFVHIWTDMDGWATKYDAREVGEELTDDEWALFERVRDETNRFHAAAAAARTGRPAAPADPGAHLHLV